jgi:Holliday junction resolvase
MCKVLINFLSDFNDHNLIATLQLKPKKVIFIRIEEDQLEGLFLDIKHYLLKKQQDLDIIQEVMERHKLERLKEILNQYSKEDVILNVSGGSKLQSLIAYEMAQQLKLRTVIIDPQMGQIFTLTRKSFESMNEGIINLSLTDLIESTGGEIVKDSTQVFNEFKFQRLINYMINHYDQWKNIKQIIRMPEFIISEKDSLQASLEIKSLNKDERKHLLKFLTILAKFNIIYPYFVSHFQIYFTFVDKTAKNFIMISGSWLEALTFQVVESFPCVTDVKSGVRFIWDESAKEVENELDVCAMTQSSFICISCKDTSNYDVDTLNELAVYSEKLGGEKSIKILVATSLPNKEPILKRAEEMGIHLIIFDGDVNGFRETLEEIIK